VGSVSNDAAAEQDANGWTLRFGEPLVTQLQVDHRFALLLGGGALIVLESAFELSSGTDTARVPPGDDASEVGEALRLLHAQVEEVRLEASGQMKIDFNDDVAVMVPANPQYENWQIVMPDGEQWIGTPGGGVTHFLGR
jgi:hypothetical protein